MAWALSMSVLARSIAWASRSLAASRLVAIGASLPVGWVPGPLPARPSMTHPTTTSTHTAAPMATTLPIVRCSDAAVSAGVLVDSPGR